MDLRLTDGFTLEEALQIAHADDENHVTDIFITPPEAHVLTDEDSGDETELIPDHFTGRQLRAEAELRFDHVHLDEDIQEENGENETQNNISDEVDIESSEDGNQGEANSSDFTYEGCQFEMDPKSKKKRKNLRWIKDGDLIDTHNEKSFPHSVYTSYKNLSAVELFELFLDESIFSMLLEEISRYALFSNHIDPRVTLSELKCFIAILIVSGYNELPGKKYYWASENDMRNEAVCNAMRRDRFFQIMRFLHCADNTKMDASDKLWKLRPLLDKLQGNCLKNFIPEQNIDYDESMIIYYGNHGCKQFIRGKPIRFGYKVWSLNTKEGYLINFEVYQGKRFIGNAVQEDLFGKAAAPSVSLLEKLPNRNLPYNFYLDNLFCSIPLLAFLRQNGFSGTGTFRDNRIPKDCPLKSKKEVREGERDTLDSCIAGDYGVLFVRWVDNSVVTVGSTSYGMQPFSNVKRYSQSEKKIIQVPRPNLIGEYNNFMGGTDQMDENSGRYRISIRGKKWWWCIFIWLVDVAINNAWILQRKSKQQHTDQLSFRREIARTYLQRHGVPPKQGGRPPTAKNSVSCNRVGVDLRYDGENHLLTNTPNKKRRRCAGEGCTSSGRTMCNKCDVGLCIECNIIFHTK